MTDDLRARIAAAIGRHCPDHYEHNWQAAADNILAEVVQPIADERDKHAAAVQRPHRIRLDVTCELGHPVGTWYDAIEEKYPFWCDTCDDYVREGKHPWKLTATVEETQ